MTPEEEATFWKLYEMFSQNKNLRKGQALMLALHHTAPIFYDMITGTTADCFHRDERIVEFLDALGIPLYAAPIKVGP